MGDIVKLAKPVDEPEPKKHKLRNEPRGFLLVPARIMDAVDELEASIEECTLDPGFTKTLDYDALYRILACLTLMSSRYE
jgi:hypothetical protein